MYKALTGLFISLGLLVPAFASASATITSTSLNGSSFVQVSPGANIVASVTATLTDGTKWKGTHWGVSQGTALTTCANTKNAKDGTRNNATGSFTETFTVKAPAQPGLYNINFRLDEANNCGKPISGLFTGTYRILVDSNVVKPVIAAHSDVAVQLVGTASGAVVSYDKPVATDRFSNSVPVSCAPASGYFFPVGDTTVTCNATDSWGHTAVPSTFKVSVIPVPPDQAPVIEQHAPVFATTTDISGEVYYSLPLATDDRDGTVVVSCTPASGSVFSLGTTTVNCSATDSGGNTAHSSFEVNLKRVLAPGTIVTLASQTDESYLCGANTGTWRACDFDANDNPGPGFTSGLDDSSASVYLGQGSTMQDGALQTVIISRDETNPFVRSNPWLVSIVCYSDAARTVACADWVAPTTANGNRTDVVREFAALNPSLDNKHWVADFTSPLRNKNFDGSAPVVFNTAYFYELVIDDQTFETAAYGSSSFKPYYVVTGKVQ